MWSSYVYDRNLKHTLYKEETKKHTVLKKGKSLLLLQYYMDIHTLKDHTIQTMTTFMYLDSSITRYISSITIHQPFLE